MLIRKETDEDYAAILALNRMVFGGDYEAELIDKLRSANLDVASLIAIDGNEIIGHIFFSQLKVEIDGRDTKVASLAPMAVRADYQRQGIGSKLVGDGLALLKKQQYDAVIVLGHTWFYPRFGFSPNLTQHLVSHFQGNPALMGLELSPGALAGKKGFVTYPAAFGLVESA